MSIRGILLIGILLFNITFETKRESITFVKSYEFPGIEIVNNNNQFAGRNENNKIFEENEFNNLGKIKIV